MLLGDRRLLNPLGLLFLVGLWLFVSFVTYVRLRIYARGKGDGEQKD